MAKGNLIFVTYASGKYKSNIYLNKLFVNIFVRPRIAYFFTDEDLKNDVIYSEYRNIFDSKVGAGFWAWKPWAILKAYEHAKEGDVIIYHDCGAGLRYKNFLYPKKLIVYAKKYDVMPGVLIPEHGINKEWTHQSCFENMDCYQEKYFQAPQVEAAISIWAVNSRTKSILEYWKSCCLQEEVISDKYIIVESGFATKGHRYDQSVLTNISIKFDLKPLAPDYIGNHIYKSLSFLELHLRRNKCIYRLIFSLFEKVILFKRYISNKRSV